MKDIFFLGSSLSDLREFPEEARRASGFQLARLQQGLEPESWKAMPSVGPGVREIRIRVNGTFRVIYLATRPEGIYVLHCFQKKTQKTAPLDIALARKRYQQIGG